MVRLSPSFVLVFAVGFFVFSMASAQELIGAKISRTEQTTSPILECSFGDLRGECLLDTGAGYSYVSDTRQSADFESEGDADAEGIDGKIQIPIVTIPRLTLGGRIGIRDVLALRSNNYPFLPEYAGMIGGTFFLTSIKTWVFDFAGLLSNGISQIIAVDRGNRDEVLKSFPSLGHLLSIDEKNRIRMQISFAGTQLNALFDTGASQTALSADFYRDHSSLYKYVGVKEITGAVKTGPKVEAQVYAIDQPYCFSGGVCIATDGQVWVLPNVGDNFEGIDMILGMDVIEKGTWYFDFDSERYGVLQKP